MPTWLMLALVAVGLPRTILADLDIVAPESSLLYYVLALTPFAVWLAVAVLRKSRRPFMDFLVLGVLYGLSLVVVHQLLWDVVLVRSGTILLPVLSASPTSSARRCARRPCGATRP